MLGSFGYHDPKPPHLSIHLPKPRPSLSHRPCGGEPPPCHTHANRRARGEARPARNYARISVGTREAVIPRPNPPPPMSVWMVDCRCASCWPSFPVPNRALRKLMTSKCAGTWEAYYLPASRGSISILYLGGARQRCIRCGCGNGGMVFGRGFGHQRGPCFLVAC